MNILCCISRIVIASGFVAPFAAVSHAANVPRAWLVSKGSRLAVLVGESEAASVLNRLADEVGDLAAGNGVDLHEHRADPEACGYTLR